MQPHRDALPERAGTERLDAEGAVIAVVTLGHGHLHTAGFRHLLWLACEQSDQRLDELVAKVLPDHDVLAVLERDEPIAFVSFHCSDVAVELEYLATHESRQSRGLGSLLVDAVRRRHPGLPLHLTTDDDAVGFYRRLGFVIAAEPPDPRWPQRRRYSCTLPPTG